LSSSCKGGGGDGATEEDESNYINREDFEEGKTKEIVTSRATPLKPNALVQKNMSTTRKNIGNSPALINAIEYKDPSNPSALYY